MVGTTLRRRWAVALIVGVAVAGAGVVALSASRTSTVAPTPGVAAEITVMGLDGGTSDPFYLDGGSYHGIWSAWGETPADPPCTHSVELMAIDPSNGTGSSGHVLDLAKLVQVPSTGTSAEFGVTDVKPGYYYLRITSACAWQIVLSPDF